MKFITKNFTIISISALFFLIAGFFSSASAYTLDELMQLSVKKRDSIKVRQGNIEKSKSSVTMARAFFIPDLNVVYEAERDLDISEAERDLDISGESSTFTVTSSVNLFAGFRDYNNLKAEKKTEEISELRLKSAKQNLQLEVAEGFTDVFRSIENLRVAESSLRLFTERYENVKLKFETGLLTRRDLLVVKVETDNAGQLVRKAAASVTKSLNRLSRITGVDDLSIEKLDFTVLSKLPVKVGYNDLEKRLLQNRSELTIQKGVKDVNLKRYNAKKSEYYPSLNLAATYTKEDVSYDPWDADEDWTAQLAVSMNLFDGLKTAAALKSRKQDVSNAQYELIELEKIMKTELTNILLDFDVAEQNLEAADSGMDEAEENVRATELAFSHGRATTTDVLNSIYSLTTAKLNVINARMDLIQTDFRVKRMVEDFIY